MINGRKDCNEDEWVGHNRRPEHHDRMAGWRLFVLVGCACDERMRRERGVRARAGRVSDTSVSDTSAKTTRETPSQSHLEKAKIKDNHRSYPILGLNQNLRS